MEGRSQDGASVIPVGNPDPAVSPQPLCVRSVLPKKGPAFSHPVSSSMKVCVPCTSSFSCTVTRASSCPLRYSCGNRFLLFSIPCVFSSATQRFTGSPRLGLLMYFPLDMSSRRKTDQSQHTRTSVFPGGSLLHGGNTGFTEAGEAESCYLWE